MGLRITLDSPETLREAVKAAAAAAQSEMVILIWTPDFFAVQSMVTAELRDKQNFSALLKIPASDGFISYDSTDRYFNAVVKAAKIEAVFFTAESSEPFEFLQSFEDNEINEFGYLHAQFGRPVGAHMKDYISLKIYGILPDKMLQSADISNDPSLNPLPPVATISADQFSKMIIAMEAFLSNAVKITVTKNKAYFLPVGKHLKPMVMTQESGLVSTRDDVGKEPIEFKLHLPLENIHTGAYLEDVVRLYRRTKDMV